MKLTYELDANDVGYWFTIRDEDTAICAEGVMRFDGSSKLTFVYQHAPIAPLGQALLDVCQAVTEAANR